MQDAAKDASEKERDRGESEMRLFFGGRQKTRLPKGLHVAVVWREHLTRLHKMAGSEVSLLTRGSVLDAMCAIVCDACTMQHAE
mgnify:CR=1 FL=1